MRQGQPTPPAFRISAPLTCMAETPGPTLEAGKHAFSHCKQAAKVQRSQLLPSGPFAVSLKHNPGLNDLTKTSAGKPGAELATGMKSPPAWKEFA